MPIVDDWLQDQASQLAGDWLVDLANKAGQSAQMTLEKAATFWVTGVSSPQLTQATDEGVFTPANTVAFLWERLDWYVAGLAVLSIFVAAGKMAWQRNGAPFWELLQSILTMIVVSSAGVATISLLTSASDQAASYILTDALTSPGDPASDFQTAFGAMFVVAAATPQTAFALVGLLALVLLASVLQIVLLIIRGGMLFLLAGVLPLTAAATNTETGRQWFRKTVAWTIAFILYKPVAAIVYATAFQLTREGGPVAPTAGDDIIKVITGLTMCVLALFALPALMRFTVPAVAAASGAGGGGAGLALSGALAMGAKNALTKSRGGGGGRSNPPQKPPTRSEGPHGGGNGPKRGSTTPGGSPNGQLGGKSAVTQGSFKTAAGPSGSMATAVADGLKKANESANSAVAQAAGEDAPAGKPGRTNAPGKDISGKGPSGGSSKPDTTAAKTPPIDSGPPGSPSGKPAPLTSPPNPPATPPTNTEGPSGGKRK